jgi:hypothetical protein
MFDAPCFNFLTTDEFLTWKRNSGKDKVNLGKKITKIVVVVT